MVIFLHVALIFRHLVEKTRPPVHQYTVPDYTRHVCSAFAHPQQSSSMYPSRCPNDNKSIQNSPFKILSKVGYCSCKDSCGVSICRRIVLVLVYVGKSSHVHVYTFTSIAQQIQRMTSPSSVLIYIYGNEQGSCKSLLEMRTQTGTNQPSLSFPLTIAFPMYRQVHCDNVTHEAIIHGKFLIFFANIRGFIDSSPLILVSTCVGLFFVPNFNNILMDICKKDSRLLF